MSEFCNLVYDHQIQQEENKHQCKGISIVDYHTVGFHKDQNLPKRSLSLNIYEYEQTLGPVDSEKSSVDSLKKLSDRKKKTMISRINRMRQRKPLPIVRNQLYYFLYL